MFAGLMGCHSNSLLHVTEGGRASGTAGSSNRKRLHRRPGYMRGEQTRLQSATHGQEEEEEEEEEEAVEQGRTTCIRNGKPGRHTDIPEATNAQRTGLTPAVRMSVMNQPDRLTCSSCQSKDFLCLVTHPLPSVDCSAVNGVFGHHSSLPLTELRLSTSPALQPSPQARLTFPVDSFNSSFSFIQQSLDSGQRTDTPPREPQPLNQTPKAQTKPAVLPLERPPSRQSAPVQPQPSSATAGQVEREELSLGGRFWRECLWAGGEVTSDLPDCDSRSLDIEVTSSLSVDSDTASASSVTSGYESATPATDQGWDNLVKKYEGVLQDCLQNNRTHTKTRGNALFLIIILGIGGSFQDGYHTAGLSSPSPYIQRFINSSWYDRYEEPPTQQEVTAIWSLIVSLYAVGGLFGVVSVKFISGMLGRKKVVIGNSFIAIAAAGIMLTSKGAKSYEMIIVARVLQGYSTGLGTSIHLIYLSEISPRNIRGIISLTSTTFASLGKLSALFFGLSEILGQEELWNVVLCVPACFSVLQVLVLPFLPEAPRYLFIEKGDIKACQKALQSLWGQGDFKQEMDEMLAEQAAIDAAPLKSPLQLLRDRAVRWQLVTMSTLFCCNQLSGKSMISAFSFDIFRNAGIPTDMIRYVTLGLGVTEILTSICCGLLIEGIGRRPLFWGGYGAMSACWFLVTVTLNLKDSTYWIPYISIALISIFIIFFCGGPAGAAAALYSEIFIQTDRLASSILMGFQRWLLFAVLGFVFPFLINALDSYSFVIFACVCLLGCLYSFFVLPETKGKTLLEISKEFKSITICGKSFLEEKRVETKL